MHKHDTGYEIQVYTFSYFNCVHTIIVNLISVRSRYSHLATEILCAGSQHFLVNLAASPTSMDSLSNFLSSEQLNPLLASYFCRIFSLLVQHHSDQVCSYEIVQEPYLNWTMFEVMQVLMRDRNFLSKMEKHIEVSSIAESIIHLCTYVEDREKSRTFSKVCISP